MQDVTGLEQEHESVTQLLADVQVQTEEKELHQQNSYTTEAPSAKPEKQTIAPVVDEQPKASAASAKTEADLYIMLADFGQTKLHSGWVRRKAEAKAINLYGTDALEKLEAARLIKERGEDVTSTDQLALLRIDKQVAEIIEALPLSESEKEQLREPLQEMIKDNGGVMPHWLRLTMAALMIVGSRTLDVKMF